MGLAEYLKMVKPSALTTPQGNQNRWFEIYKA